MPLVVAYLLAGSVVLMVAARIWSCGIRHGASARPASFDHDAMVFSVNTLRERGRRLSGDASLAGARSFVSICEEGIRFRVFSEAQWSFSDMAYLDVFQRPAGTQLIFCAKDGRRMVVVTVADCRVARQVLAGLPPTFRLSEPATRLRDENSNVAASEAGS